jgi:hypothetical protein
VSLCVWMERFSFRHGARARSGGCRWSPAMSRTLSTKYGSMESLTPSVRCGAKARACQYARDGRLAQSQVSGELYGWASGRRSLARLPASW